MKKKYLFVAFVLMGFLATNCQSETDGKAGESRSEIIEEEEEEKTEEKTASPPVEMHGHLRVEGNKIVGKNGDPVQLVGMSLFWSQWMGKYYNAEAIHWLKDDWKCTVVRAAMGIDHGGYLQNPDEEKEKVKAVVEAAIEAGIYVIIDWHDHEAEKHLMEAKAFFAEMAQQYGQYPNVIYETYNEPLDVSWADVLKPYHEAVIDTIRHYDPDNLIVCGTRNWSQQILEPANDPIDDQNVAYVLHFYASTHKQWLRDRAKQALDKGIAIMVTEYGTTEASGNGYLDVKETKAWWQFMDDHKISWANWSVADKNEKSAALKPGSGGAGGWTDQSITESGKLVRRELRAKNP